MQTSLNILLLTNREKNYSSQRIISAARNHGHNLAVRKTTSFVLRGQTEIGKPSKYDAIIPRVGGPLVNFGAALVRSFENDDVFTTASSTGLEISKDKFKTSQILTQNGLATPRTVSLATISNLDEAISYLGGYPVIFKRLTGSQGRAVFLIGDEKTAAPLIQSFISSREGFLVQEFVKEANGSDLRCFVVDGKVVGAMMRTAADGDFRSNVHQGGTVKKVRLTAEERRASIKAAKILKLNVAGVDILRSSTGPKILEVNSSPGLEGIEKATGKDIAGEIISCIENNVRTVFRTGKK